MRTTAYVAYAAAMLTYCTHTATSQTVYAIIAADNESSLPGVTKNVDAIEGILSSLKIEGGIPVVIHEVKGDNFGCQAIRDAVANTNWGKDDTVIFYYAGHGYKDTPAQSKFPGLDCRMSQAEPRTDLNGIVSMMSEPGPIASPPRLIIAVADACNTGSEQVVTAPAGQPASGAKRREALRKLFLGYSGRLIMSGCIPGEWCFYIPGQGGLFTLTRFVTAIDRAVNSGSAASWPKIVDEATRVIKVPTNAWGQATQAPQSSDLKELSEASSR